MVDEEPPRSAVRYFPSEMVLRIASWIRSALSCSSRWRSIVTELSSRAVGFARFYTDWNQSASYWLGTWLLKNEICTKERVDEREKTSQSTITGKKSNSNRCTEQSNPIYEGLLRSSSHFPHTKERKKEERAYKTNSQTFNLWSEVQKSNEECNQIPTKDPSTELI